METKSPHSKFSVMPALLALFVGVLHLPALNVFRVNARGHGDVHAHPGQVKTSGRLSIAEAMTRVVALCRRLAGLSRHPLFRPVAALGALGLALLINVHAVWAAPVIFGVLTEGTRTAEFLISELKGPAAPSREAITVLSGQNLAAGAVVGRVTKGIGRVSIPSVVGTGTGTVTNVYAGPEVEVGNYVMTCTAAVANGGVFSLVAPDGHALPALTMTPGSGGTTNYRSRHINFTITDSTDFVVGDVFTFVVGTTAPTVIGGTGTGTISALALGPDAKLGNYRVICTAAVSNGGVWQVYRGGPNGGESIGIYTQTPGSTTATAFETREISFTITDATDFIVGNYFDVCVFASLAGGKVAAWDPTTYDGRHVAVGALYAAINATSADTPGVIVNNNAAFQKNALSWGAAITVSQKDSAYGDLLKRYIVCRDGVIV